jgi:hypothetical protein
MGMTKVPVMNKRYDVAEAESMDSPLRMDLTSTFDEKQLCGHKQVTQVTFKKSKPSKSLLVSLQIARSLRLM